MVALVAPPLAIPVHYDDYTVFRSPLSDFLDEFRRRQLPGEVRIVARGRRSHCPPGRPSSCSHRRASVGMAGKAGG